MTQHSKASILLADDDPAFRKQLEAFLEMRYDVVAVENGKSALEGMKRRIPDLVISDVSMEPINGYELCELLKTDPKFCLIPVILLTGESARKNKLWGLGQGADDYIVKPFDPDELLTRVENLLRIRKLQNELFQTSYLKSMAGLVGGLSHEMNNPLGFMNGNLVALEEGVRRLVQWSQLLDAEVSTESKNRLQEKWQELEIEQFYEEYDSILAGLKRGSERIAGVVKSLRGFVQDGDYDESRVSISDSLLTLTHLLNSPYVDIQLSDDLDENEKWPIAVNHALQHLVSNAIEAVQTGDDGKKSPPGHVWIHARKENNLIVLVVRDDGVGIAEEIRSRIFAPFFTTKPGHTGIGLGIAFSVTLKYGGSISFESNQNYTEFTLSVPSGL